MNEALADATAARHAPGNGSGLLSLLRTPADVAAQAAFPLTAPRIARRARPDAARRPLHHP